jgi:FkbM family methyltransferase
MTFASRIAGFLPRSVEDSLRARYWNFKSHLLYRRLYEFLDLQYTLQSGLMVQVATKGEWWSYNDIFVNQEYDLPIQCALAARSAEDSFTVLDLGANVGYFVLRLVDLMRRNGLQHLATDLISVEGSPSVFRQLEQRLAQQDLSPVTPRLIHGLVGRRTGNSTIREYALHVKNTIMPGEQLHDRSGGVEVGFVDLAPVFEGRTIDLLKCDVEGSELLFLENYGDMLSRVRHAVFEFHDKFCDTARCVSILQDSGFRQQVLRSNPDISVRFFSKG